MATSVHRRFQSGENSRGKATTIIVLAYRFRVLHDLPGRVQIFLKEETVIRYVNVVRLVVVNKRISQQCHLFLYL